ncbi:uncharacterized protein TA18370 [Theileria annulata]|uniref:Uncharacterized protein n=1 Tax=Theileria annulata TaxID=5874 RepID=Q4UAX9_THEAN|nr:uncharacterized protein TA18370 [Theileria annulata]CAI76022.1 hypothetical protein TA18370 [Theileria annulata]|eukprot:XP_955498.1 hypothetical protein TA18370 [Theileria annulata]
MSFNDKNLSMSFNFFKKRKKSKSSKSKELSPLSNLSLSESYLNGSQNSRLTPIKYNLTKRGSVDAFDRDSSDRRVNSIKRGSFRGILNDFGTPASQSSVTQSSTQNDENDLIPIKPFINLELCKPFNYIFWEMEEKSKNGYGIEKCINNVIYNNMKDIYESYCYLIENQCQISNWSTVYLNSYHYLKPINLTNFHYNFNIHTIIQRLDNMEEEKELEELESVIDNVNIAGEIINGPVFIHESLLKSFNNNYELLPSKINNGYEHKKYGIEYDYLHNLINRMLYERALKQLIIIKSNVDIDFINLNLIEVLRYGVRSTATNSPERGALVIYPSKGHSTIVLTLLDYIFIMNSKKLYIPNMKKNEDVYGYISKISGIVEDIRYTRLKKIYSFLENLKMEQKIIKLDHFQFSETYIINQYLSGYCSFDDKNKKTSKLPWKQVDYLLSDLENNLMDSLNYKLI